MKLTVKELQEKLAKFDPETFVCLRVHDHRWPDKPVHVVDALHLDISDNFIPTLNIELDLW